MYILTYFVIGILVLTLVPKALRLFSRNKINSLSVAELKELQNQAYDENAPEWLAELLKDTGETDWTEIANIYIEAIMLSGEDLNLFGKIVMRTWTVLCMVGNALFLLAAWPVFAGMDIGYEIKIIQAVSFKEVM